MNERIHPTAVIDPGAQIAGDVVIGPHAIIDDNVVIGAGSVIQAGARIASGARLGREVKVFSYAVVGTIPQDLKFGGEATTCEIGDRTVIREFATLNRGTTAHNRTVVGADCFLMAYSHVAHDCIVGDHCILANSATLAGHVTLEDWVTVGGLVPIHQFVTVGCHVMIGGGWRVPKDVPPYMLAAGDPLRAVDVNKIGLARRGFSPESIANIRKAHKALFRSDTNLTQSMEKLDAMGDLGPEVEHLKKFVRESQRGVII